jgi:pyridoxamine 5'-phosphate oxidase
MAAPDSAHDAHDHADEPSDPTARAVAATTDPIALLADWAADAERDAADRGTGGDWRAVVLATTGDDGAPDARTLLLQQVTADGPRVSGLATSPKGRQLAADPRAALVARWGSRQVRVRGAAVVGDAEAAAGDFRRRHPGSRATALVGRQSEALDADADELVREARERVESDPELVPDGWTTWVLVPVSVEFWWMAPGAGERRVRFTRAGGADRVDGAWTREALWP